MLSKLGAARRGTRFSQAELEGRPEVVPLRVHAPEQLGLSIVEGPDRPCQPGDPREVAILDARLVAGFTQSLPAELADRLQQPVSRRIPALQLAPNDRLLDQRAEQFHHLPLRHPLVGTDLDGGRRIEPAREHRQPSPQQLLCLVEQAVAPSDGGLEGLLAGFRPRFPFPSTDSEPARPSLSWSRLNAPKRTAASSSAKGIPSRRRQSCRTASAFLSSTAKSGTTAAARSLSNRTASELASVSADGSSPSPGSRHRRHRHPDFAAHPECLPACGEEMQIRATLQERAGQDGARVQQVLAVVEHEQEAFAGEEVRERDQRPVG